MTVLASFVPCLCACHGADDAGESLLNADLVFVKAASSSMDKAIDSSTLVSSDTLGSYSHVAIIEVVNDSIYVVEALPLKGVVRRPFEEFCEENCNYTFRRVKPEIVSGIAQRQGVSDDMVRWMFVQRAKSRIGEGYDYIYGPDNGLCYCSELVYDSYIDTAAIPGDCHLFSAAPMNFLDAEGNLPEFWAGLFEAFNVPVPQGVHGTNPNDMFRSDVLAELPVDIRRPAM